MQLDKLSLLEETQKYITRLVQEMEEKELQREARRATQKTAAHHNHKLKAQAQAQAPSEDSDESSCSDATSLINTSSTDGPTTYTIEALEGGGEILITMVCKEGGDLTGKIDREMRRLDLKPSYCNCMGFGKDSVVVHMLVRMKDDSCMTGDGLVRHLRRALAEFL